MSATDTNAPADRSILARTGAQLKGDTMDDERIVRAGGQVDPV
jgi:hypothetical protein